MKLRRTKNCAILGHPVHIEVWKMDLLKSLTTYLPANLEFIAEINSLFRLFSPRK